MICGFCEKGELVASSVAETFSYKGNDIVIPDYEISECGICGESIVTREQSRRNQRKLADAKRRVDGLMTSDRMIALRARLGNISQSFASVLFTGSDGTWFKYESGDVIQSVGLDRTMRLIERHPALIKDLADMAELEMICPTHISSSRSISASETKDTFLWVLAVDKTEAVISTDASQKKRASIGGEFSLGRRSTDIGHIAPRWKRETAEA